MSQNWFGPAVPPQHLTPAMPNWFGPAVRIQDRFPGIADGLLVYEQVNNVYKEPAQHNER